MRAFSKYHPLCPNFNQFWPNENAKELSGFVTSAFIDTMSLIVLGRSFPCAAQHSANPLSLSLSFSQTLLNLTNPSYHQQFWHCGRCQLFSFCRTSKEAHPVDCVARQRDDRNQESLWHTAKEHFRSPWRSTISGGFQLLSLNRRDSTEWRPIHGLLYTGTTTVRLDARIPSGSANNMRLCCQKNRLEVARVNTQSLTLGEDCNSGA